MPGCLREGTYGTLAIAFLKHLPNQELWTEDKRHSPCSQSNQRQRSTGMNQKRSTFMKQYICVCKPIRRCQGDHPVRTMKWASLGFDGSEEQTERKNKGGDEKKSTWEVGKRRCYGLNSVLPPNYYVLIPSTPECD